MNEKVSGLAPVFGELDMQIHGFKKDTYADLFAGFLEKHHDFFEEINRMLVSDGADGFIKEFAEAVAAFAREKMENAGGKAKKERIQLNLNMFMAIYFMPAILEGKQTRAKDLTDELCRVWAESFKGNNIQAADYATIVSGFKTKLCYVTTAVCRSMNKPEDCYELTLLKKYRDGYLLRTDNGEELVQEYYDIAPTIVKRIDKSGNAEKKYRWIWENYLKPCIAMIENGENEECAKTYIRMVEELKEEFVVTDKKSGIVYRKEQGAER